MTLYEFTPPTFDELAWDQSSPLFRHFGTLPVGHTIFKDTNGDWHTLDEGYEETGSSGQPGALDDAVIVYRGGRVYYVTFEELVELFINGFIPFVEAGLYPGLYPGYYPVGGPSVEPPPVGGTSDPTYPGAGLYPGTDTLPGEL